MHTTCKSLDFQSKRVNRPTHKNVQRHVECPSAYQVFRLPVAPGSADFPAAWYRVGATLCGMGEAASKIFRTEGESEDILPVAETSVMMWRDSTVWELSHAALKAVRGKLDEAFFQKHPQRRLRATAGVGSSSPSSTTEGGGEGGARNEEEEVKEENIKNPHSTARQQQQRHVPPAQYLLNWWVGVLSFQQSKVDFQHIMEVKCEQVMADHPLLLPTMPRFSSPDPRLTVLSETEGFPGPGSTLFLVCERIQ